MDILLNSQAKETLKSKIIPDSSAGIICENGNFSWWINLNGIFDTGETETFDESFTIIKKLTSKKN